MNTPCFRLHSDKTAEEAPPRGQLLPSELPTVTPGRSSPSQACPAVPQGLVPRVAVLSLPRWPKLR